MTQREEALFSALWMLISAIDKIDAQRRQGGDVAGAVEQAFRMADGYAAEFPGERKWVRPV